MMVSDTNNVAPPGEARPLFTIAIPTFNRSALLKGCVAAALAQTYADFEVVVSDNASTDETPAMLTGFTDSRLRVVKQATNIGLAPNWNACLAHARGDYILFVSDDDRVAPHFLARCADLIAKEPTLPVVIGLSDIHNASLNRTKPTSISQKHATSVIKGTDVLHELFADRITVTMCSVVMRTELFRAHGGLPLDLPHMSDIAAFVKLLFLGSAGFINEAVATFTFHERSETARLTVDHLLVDGSRVVDLVGQCAARHTTLDVDRKAIVREARSFFARRALIVLSDRRRSGGSLMEVLAAMWRCRREFTGVDMTAVLRFVAKLLCPDVVAMKLRQRQGLPARLA